MRTLLRALAAVLAGNALYFLVLARLAPGWARHEPFTLDLGLLLDFLVCLAIYAGLGAVALRGRHSA